MFEGFGTSLLDALILGLNVLASDIPSNREIDNIFFPEGKLILLELANLNTWILMLKKIADINDHITALKVERIFNFTFSIINLSKIFDEKLYELIVK